MFNKGLSKDDKKEEILKRIENIKDKNEKIVNTFHTTNKSSINKINDQGKKLIYNAEHRFAKLRNINNIKKISPDSMFNLMREYHKKFTSLKNLVPPIKNNKELKQKVLNNVGDIYNELHYIYKNKYNKKINSLDTKNRKKLDYKKLRLTDDYLYFKKKTDIDSELFMKPFNFQNPSDMLKNLYQINDKEKKNKLVNVINSGLKDLKEEIIENTNKMVEIVKDILRFIKQKQEGQGIKILTPNQMLSRLPISLAQLKAGNKSQKLKNEIRQLLYSLYCSKNMTKQVYHNLIKPI